MSTHIKSPLETCQENNLPFEIASPPVHVYSAVFPEILIQVLPAMFPAGSAETKALAADPPHHLFVRVMSSARRHAKPT
jgi:hypothetical protein